MALQQKAMSESSPAFPTWWLLYMENKPRRIVHPGISSWYGMMKVTLTAFLLGLQIFFQTVGNNFPAEVCGPYGIWNIH